MDRESSHRSDYRLYDYEQPWSFSVDDGLSIQERSVRGHLSSFRLALDIPEGTNGNASSNDANDEQTETCDSLRKNQMVEEIIRLIVGTIALPLGCWLVFKSEKHSLLDWIGTALITIGFFAFFLPPYWQTCKQNNDEYHQGFQHGATVPQANVREAL